MRNQIFTVVLGPLLLSGIITPISGSTPSALRSQLKTSIVGCYSDLKPTGDGDIVGNGIFRITKRNGRYFASFRELVTDGADYAPTRQVEHLKVDERSRKITFDLPIGQNASAKIIRGVYGQVSSRGIKMNWHGNRGEYGAPNPFMLRRSQNCL
jgi:hypothetical protein